MYYYILVWILNLTQRRINSIRELFPYTLHASQIIPTPFNISIQISFISSSSTTFSNFIYVKIKISKSAISKEKFSKHFLSFFFNKPSLLKYISLGVKSISTKPHLNHNSHQSLPLLNSHNP